MITYRYITCNPDVEFNEIELLFPTGIGEENLEIRIMKK
jgi:hypothetical protein